MTSFQKVIKYLAIALAIYLSINIILAIVFGAITIFEVFSLFNSEENIIENMQILSRENEQIINLDIKLDYTNLEIKNANKFKVETNNKNIAYKNNNGNIVIKEDKILWDFKGENEKSKLIIYIPNTIKKFNSIKIDIQAGNIKVFNLKSDNFKFTQGVGKTLFSDIKITKMADMEAGAGNLEIDNSTINNFDLDLGVGKINFKGILKGNTKVETGLGSVKIKLMDNFNNYKIKSNKVLGDVKINNKSILNNELVGTGETNINIECRIGSILID